MMLSRRLIVVPAMLALMLSQSAPAMAAGTSGSASSDPLASSSVTPFTTVNVGGGTWNYGRGLSNPWTMHVWSHYVHPKLRHSGTAISGPYNNKVFANATLWANADVYDNNIFDGGYEYWATY